MERRWIALIAIVVVVVVIGAAVTEIEANKGPTKQTLNETGSSLLYPVFQAYAPNYTAATIKTASTGSGTGISSAEAGTVQIGASDAFILGTIPSNVENIPIMISYQYIAYNVSGLSKPLNLSGDIVAGIYMGTITKWNDAAIQAANPGTSLPNKTIVPVHRSDGSGDSFMFSSFLSKSNSTWASKIGTSTNPNWPSVAGALAGNGNQGIINDVKGTGYSIGYIAATYSSQVSADHFGIANLLNKAGNYVGASVANVSAAASQYLSEIPANGSIALQFAPGATSYPIADMEYVVVQFKQSSAAIANALQAFLKWIVNSTDGGSVSSYMNHFNLVALPSNVISGIVDPEINKITS